MITPTIEPEWDESLDGLPYPALTEQELDEAAEYYRSLCERELVELLVENKHPEIRL